MWIARWYEWVFGPIIMTSVGVTLVLQSLSGFYRWVLIIGLLLYLIASLARLVDDTIKGRHTLLRL